MYTDEEMLMLSGLQHLAFCERQWALIHLEQQWADNHDTARGELFHERADTGGYSSSKGIRVVRSMRLSSYTLGIVGVADIVEFSEINKVCGNDEYTVQSINPIEYKVGKPKIEDWDRLQLCAQTLCLEEMFSCKISEGALFYGETRRREKVLCDQQLRLRVMSLAEKMHVLFYERRTPKAQKKPRCRRCSLIDICLPETGDAIAREYWQKEGFLRGRHQ